MKVHAGADAGSGYVHTITGTSANRHDVSETSKLPGKMTMSCMVIPDILAYLSVPR